MHSNLALRSRVKFHSVLKPKETLTFFSEKDFNICAF